jgi:16S rRNA A1518/A1519 N6-dimethyltransferase RsmA/KsgA/DIM1 with predicted DNA glycosylase/AP lyase activity
VDGLLAAAGLKGDERAETLSVETFLRMARVL